MSNYCFDVKIPDRKLTFQEDAQEKVGLHKSALLKISLVKVPMNFRYKVEVAHSSPKALEDVPFTVWLVWSTSAPG